MLIGVLLRLLHSFLAPLIVCALKCLPLPLDSTAPLFAINNARSLILSRDS